MPIPINEHRDGHFNRFFEKPKSLPQWLFFLFRCLFLFVFTLLYIGVCFFNGNSRFNYNMGLALVVGVGLFFAILLVTQKIKVAANRSRGVKRLLVRHNLFVFFLCMAALFALQCRFDAALYYPVGWDVSAIVQGAGNLGTLYKNDYFSQFPNNLLLVCVLHLLLRIYSFFGGTNIWLYLAIINTAVVDIAIGCVFFIGRKLWGIAAGFVSFFIMVMLFGFSPWILVPYSDTFSMWVPPVALLLFINAQKTKRLPVRMVLYFIVGLVSMIGFYLKPFTLIITVAIIMVALIQSIGGFKRFAAFVLSVAMIVSGAGCVFELNRTQITDRFASQIDTAKEIPFTHFLMMGMNVQISGATGKALYGAYNADDYRITLQQQTKEEKVNKNLQVIKERLKAFGPVGYASFLAKKANWIFSDGVFWVEGEGDDVDTLSVSQDPLSNLIQSFFRFYGWNFHWYTDTEQGVWTLTMFLMVCPLFLKKNDYICDDSIIRLRNIGNSAIMTCRIALLGLLFYLLLFEARSRYLISFLPLVALLAGYGFSLFSRNLDKYKAENNAETAKGVVKERQ